MNRTSQIAFKLILGAALCLSTQLSAVMTENVVHEGFTALDKGEFHNVGITFDGKIFPTQELTELANIPASIVWQAVVDNEGQLIVSTGNNGTVYRINQEGESTVIFQPEEALSRALAIDKENRIYVGTSPKGRVYRILPDGTQEIFFDPQDLYIWDIEISDDTLYIATGGRGKIYRVPTSFRVGDEPEVLFEASEIHVNKIAFTYDKSALIIGCGSGGNLYRLELTGEYYALFHSGADEIKTIFPQEDGTVYFSTFSSGKNNASSDNSGSVGSKDSDSSDDTSTPNPYLFNVYAKDLPEDNGLMELDADGNVRPIWSLPPNKIFSVYHQEDGKWLIGSGTNGRVFRTEGLTEWSNVFTVESGGEVTQILPADSESGSLYIVSSNPARIYKLGSAISADAEYTSDVIDTGKMVDWGTLRYLSVTGEFENHIEISTRSGNIEDPNRSWSDWQPLEGNRIQSPNSRFVQYKVKMLPENPGIQRVQLYFQEQNLHPMVDEIKILPGAYRMFTTPKPSQNLNFASVFTNQSSFLMQQRIPQLVKEKEEGAITAIWLPADPNQDRLMFDLEVKQVGDPDWLKIASEMEDPIYAMDIRGLEEGYYQLRVIADDRLDNEPAKSLKYAKVSDPFLIDFTSPVVTLERDSTDADVNTVSLHIQVSDRFGIIERAYYSLNGGHILKALPEDGMFDSTDERFDLSFDDLTPGSYSLVFQGYDENGNVGVATYRFVIE